MVGVYGLVFIGAINKFYFTFIIHRIHMNFSDAFKQTSQLCRFSPDGVYLVLCLFTFWEFDYGVSMIRGAQLGVHIKHASAHIGTSAHRRRCGKGVVRGGQGGGRCVFSSRHFRRKQRIVWQSKTHIGQRRRSSWMVLPKNRPGQA